MLDIITPDHPDVKRHGYNYPSSITFTAERLYFSVKLKGLTGFEVGDNITFITDIDRLYFTKTDLKSWQLKHNSYGAMEINGRSLIAFLQEKYRFLRFQPYPVKRAKAELGPYPLWEILLDKKIPAPRTKKKKTKK